MTSFPDLFAAVGPRVRLSPFLDRTISAGLTSVSVYNHMWLPMSYGDPEAEYDRLVNVVSMWDVAAQRHVEVTGHDADALVQALSIVDTSDQQIGSARYAPMVDFDGTLINDPVLLHVDTSQWRFSISDSDVRPWMSAIAELHRLDCDVRELDTATLAVQGPRADEVIRALGAPWATELDDFHFANGTIDALDLIISASGWSNQGGYEIFLDDPTRAESLWDLVASAGADVGIGPGAPNPSERIESVLLSYGTDTGYDANPFELGLGDLVDFDAGPFVGSDALASIRDGHPARQLLGVRLDGPRLDGSLERPRPVSVNGAPAGQLRAAAWSPRFETNLGLALVSAELDPGNEITVDDPVSERNDHDGRTLDRATLVALPFEQ